MFLPHPERQVPCGSRPSSWVCTGDGTAPTLTITAIAPGTATTVTNAVTVSTTDTESDTTNNSDSETTTVSECLGRLLKDHTVAGEEIEEACGSIMTGPNYWVAGTGDLTLRSETAIVLGDGFAVQLGGKLTLAIEP